MSITTLLYALIFLLVSNETFTTCNIRSSECSGSNEKSNLKAITNDDSFDDDIAPPSTVESYEILNNEYQLDNQVIPFASPIVIETTQLDSKDLKFTIYVNNAQLYDVTYEVVDGQVLKINPGSAKSGELSNDEKALIAIFSTTKRIAYKDHETIEIRTNETSISLRLRAGLPSFTRALEEEHGYYKAHLYEVVPDSYQVDGRRLQLFPQNNNVPLTLETYEIYPGHLNVILKVFNTIQYQIKYQPADGWVIAIDAIPTIMDHGSQDYQMNVEKKLTAILSVTEQIAFEKDGLIQFITKSGATRIAFRKVTALTTHGYDLLNYLQYSQPNIYIPISDSYQVKNVKLELVPPSVDIPIILQVIRVYPGRINLILKAYNTVEFQINFKPADGWIKGITSTFSTYEPGPQNLMELERKLISIIQGTQQISFEENGILQFINNDELTRISFKPQSHVKPFDSHLTVEYPPSMDVMTAYSNPNANFHQDSATILGEFSVPHYYKLIPSSYFINGISERLFPISMMSATLQATEVYSGRLDVTLRVYNIIKYQISYRTKDGFVTSIIPGPSTINTGPQYMMEAEEKLKSVIGKAEYIFIDTYKQLYFSKNNHKSIIAFAPTSPPNQRQLRDAITDVPRFSEPHNYHVLAKSYEVNGKHVPLFSGNNLEFPVTVQVTRVYSGRLDVILRVYNIYKYQINFRETDNVVTEVILGPLTSNPVPQHMTDVENKIKTIIHTANKVVFDEKHDAIKFINGDSVVVFGTELETTAIAVPSILQGFNSHNEVQSPTSSSDSYTVVAPSYQVNGKHIQLFSNYAEFPISLQIRKIYPGRLDVTLKVYNTIKYEYRYEVASGWVIEIIRGDSTSFLGQQHIIEVENKLKDLLGSAQQIAFNNDGKIQFIANKSADRISFKPEVTETSLVSHQEILPSPSNHLSVVAGSYQVNGQHHQLFNNNVEIPVTLEAVEITPGVLDLTLRIHNSYKFRINYQVLDGWVTSIIPGESTANFGSSMHVLDIEYKLMSIIQSAERVVKEKDGQVWFIANQAANRIAFKQQISLLTGYEVHPQSTASPKFYNVAAWSYQVDGQHPQLFPNNVEFPATLETLQVYPGRLDITLRVYNTIRYQINYQILDGWVISITQDPLPSYAGPQHLIEVETKLKAIIGSTQKIYVEKNGMIQFITKNSLTRVAFKPQTSLQIAGVQFSHNNSLKKDDTKIYNLLANSYLVDGRHVSLFSNNVEVPVTLKTEVLFPGRLDITLRVYNTLRYRIDFQTVDGWITSIIPESVDLYAGPQHFMEVENKLKTMIESAQQLSFEENGDVQLITKNRGTRVTFKPKTSSLVQVRPNNENSHISSKHYDVIEGSYKVDGQSLQLFPNKVGFPATLETSSSSSGHLDVTLKVHNTIKYHITYRAVDGWVTSINLIPSILTLGPSNVMDVENKLKAIIGSSQQLAFEVDGLLQFISNNGATRIAFKPQPSSDSVNYAMAAEVLEKTVKYYTIIPNSYQINDKRLKLIPDNSEVSIVLETIESNPGHLSVSLKVFNTRKFQFKYQIFDGWVTSIIPDTTDPLNYSGPPALVEIETKLKAIFESTQQIAFEKDGLIQFITNNGATRVAFKPKIYSL